ncbi:XRE family transcriptional regulator [Nakamurella silvestris]|nr:XRE family transcriptional regulator [Nakamurella silvestris]
MSYRSTNRLSATSPDRSDADRPVPFRSAGDLTRSRGAAAGGLPKRSALHPVADLPSLERRSAGDRHLVPVPEPEDVSGPGICDEVVRPLSLAQFSTHMEHLRVTLRQARLSRGVTLAQLHGWSGGQFAGHTVGAWERGNRDITVARLLQLAHLYGVPIAEFFGAEEPFDTDCEITVRARRLVDDESGPLAAYAMSRVAEGDESIDPTITLTGAQIRMLATTQHTDPHELLERLRSYV